MPFKRLPKRFTIETVCRTIQLVNLLPKQNGIHQVLSPREIVTGKQFHCPTIRIGQYVQGHKGGTNEIEKYRTEDALYIGYTNSGKAHSIFKLDTL